MNIQHQFSLKDYNTFHINCEAALFVDITTPSDLVNLLFTTERKTTKKKLFLWGWSNMLLTEEQFDGLVIHNAIFGKEIVSDTPREVYMKVWGWENRNDFVRRTIEQGLYGLENLVSIPGNVAAAPIQNIGAYGMDVESSILQVWWIDLRTGTYETFSHGDCQFAYRSSIFKTTHKEDFFITDVTFRLQHYDKDNYAPIVHYENVDAELQKRWVIKPSPKDVANAIAAIRASKLPNPDLVGTAGSFFKNVVFSKEEYYDFLQRLDVLKPGLQPEFYLLDWEFYKIPTWRILDHALGYRGYRDGNVGCRDHQALCIVNYGWATGQDIVAFTRKLQKECQDKLGVHIEPEVNFIQ